MWAFPGYSPFESIPDTSSTHFFTVAMNPIRGPLFEMHSVIWPTSCVPEGVEFPRKGRMLVFLLPLGPSVYHQP